MKKYHCLLLLILVPVANLFAQPKVNVSHQMQAAVKQYRAMLLQLKDHQSFPQAIAPDGTLRTMPSDWWCSGFFAGALWYMTDYMGDLQLKKEAEAWTVALQKEQYNKGTHDLGFMLYSSYGHAYRVTQDSAYKAVLLNGAASLATRYSPKVGLIKSWDNFHGFTYPVIIDNMMNLEYLFWAAKASGDKRYYNICISHADKTLENHFRPDHSSYHVVCYDSLGNVLAKKTSQGNADNSAWARGQTWGLYGYTMMYRETKNPKYLDQAKLIAAFWMYHANMPPDKIPYWDLNSPLIPNDVRDASAAAVAASALLELSTYVKGGLGKSYFSYAEQVLASLSGPEYFAAEGSQHFLIKHSTGNKPANGEVDVPIIYGDYYYIEALWRYDRLNKGLQLN